MSLIHHLQQVADYRTKPLYPLWVVLLLVIMGIMSGCTGYRALESFVRSTGCTWSLFHNGCTSYPKKTVQQIVDSGNDYLIAVKGNQPNLYQELNTQFEQAVEMNTDIQVDSSHGRQADCLTQVSQKQAERRKE